MKGNAQQLLASGGLALACALTAAGQAAKPAAKPAAAAAAAPAAAPATVAIVDARIVPVTGAVIPVGTIVWTNGKIAALGATVKAPAGAKVINGKGLSVYPGFVDDESSVGIEEVTGQAIGTVDTTELGDFNPQLISSIAVNPTSLVLDATRANGVTTAMVTMRGGRIPAQASVIDLGLYTNDEMNVRRAAALWVNLPGGRGGGRGAGGGGALAAPGAAATAAPAGPTPEQQLDDYFDAARRYNAVATHAYTDMAMAAMKPYLDGTLPVIVPASAAADIRSAIEWGKKQKVKLVIAGANYAWQTIPDLQAAKNPDGTPVPVLYGPVITMPGANDPYDAVYAAPAALAKANIPFAIITGPAAADARNLLFNAALAEGFGLDPEAALKSITIWPAQILGLDKELGSLEVGKRANVLVTNGDPIDPRTQFSHIFIDGLEMPDSHQKQLYDQWMARPDGH